MYIVFSKKLSDKHCRRLREGFADQTFYFCSNKAELSAEIEKADILVCFQNDINEEMVHNARRLKWIMVLSAGVEQLPVASIQEKGIVVTNVRGIHKIQMSEYVISMLLQVYRQSAILYDQEKEHKWNNRVYINEITGKTMLVLGTGSIGQEIARLAKAFHMRTIGLSRYGNEKANFDEVANIEQIDEYLGMADFVISVLPGTKATNGLLTCDHFKHMKNDAVFMNIGRGNVVREDVLLEAVRNKEIGHIVLDVFDGEPLNEKHPFWDEGNITVTPHISGLSPHYTKRAIDIFIHNLDLFITGDTNLDNIVDVVKGY